MDVEFQGYIHKDAKSHIEEQHIKTGCANFQTMTFFSSNEKLFFNLSFSSMTLFSR